jgi:hypothetical protein
VLPSLYQQWKFLPPPPSYPERYHWKGKGMGPVARLYLVTNTQSSYSCRKFNPSDLVCRQSLYAFSHHGVLFLRELISCIYCTSVSTSTHLVLLPLYILLSLCCKKNLIIQIQALYILNMLDITSKIPIAARIAIINLRTKAVHVRQTCVRFIFLRNFTLLDTSAIKPEQIKFSRLHSCYFVFCKYYLNK